MKYIIYKDRKYNPDARGLYFYRAIYVNGKRKNKALHREVWEEKNGEIPEGYHIHHKDGNRMNNDISNLEAVSGSLHLSTHMKERFSNRKYREKNSKLLRSVSRKAAKWHGSKEGLKLHKRLGRLTWDKKRKVQKSCLYCGKSFKTYFPTRSKFCTNLCWQRSRYAPK